MLTRSSGARKINEKTLTVRITRGFNPGWRRVYLFPEGFSQFISNGTNLFIQPIMARKSFLDCFWCLHVTRCDAYIPEGRHKHRQGPDPCEPAVPEEKKKNTDWFSCPW